MATLQQVYIQWVAVEQVRMWFRIDSAMFCDPMTPCLSFLSSHPPFAFVRSFSPFALWQETPFISMPPEKNINRVYRGSSASTLDSSNYLPGRRTISRYRDEEGHNKNEERARSGRCLGANERTAAKLRAKTGPLSYCDRTY